MIFWFKVFVTIIIIIIFGYIVSLYMSDDYCFCNGYQSCIGSYKKSSDADCWDVGSHASCVNIDQITVLCRWCFAKFGCAASKIAEYFCAWSELEGNKYDWRTFIHIYDTLVLYQKRIYSNGYSVNIRMCGCCSEYNNTLHCESDRCSVTCYGNGTFRFELDCVTGASCSVTCDSSADIASPHGYISSTETGNICVDKVSESVILRLNQVGKGLGGYQNL